MPEDTPRYCEVTCIDDVAIARLTIHQLRDAPTCYALRDQLVEAFERHSPRHAILDLEQVEFISSVGFLAFMAVRRNIADGRVLLCGVAEPLQDVFRLCRLLPTKPDQTTPFELADTVADAQSKLADGR